MVEHSTIYPALVTDGEEVDALVAELPAAEWNRDTPAPGWTIAHQIAHLAATFRLAGLAASDPATFEKMIGGLGPDFNANVTQAMAGFLAEPPEALLARWRTERVTTERALASLPPGQIVPWLVRPLPAGVLAAAGMMELFAHGQDVADALGVQRRYTDRLGHLVSFAVRTWDFGYQARSLPTPDVEFRFDITGPSGTVWSYGPNDAEQRISGPAADFCLLVTRRRHPDDLAVVATGPEAEHWLTVAQAYRGPAGPGRQPRRATAAAGS